MEESTYRTLLKEIAKQLPGKDIMEELRCDDPKIFRKYPVTLTDDLIIRIHQALEN